MWRCMPFPSMPLSPPAPVRAPAGRQRHRSWLWPRPGSRQRCTTSRGVPSRLTTPFRLRPKRCFAISTAMAGNMAFDHERGVLNGVYDFADAGLGSRARDLNYSSFISADLTDRLVAAYEHATGTYDRSPRGRIAHRRAASRRVGRRTPRTPAGLWPMWFTGTITCNRAKTCASSARDRTARPSAASRPGSNRCRSRSA